MKLLKNRAAWRRFLRNDCSMSKTDADSEREPLGRWGGGYLDTLSVGNIDIYGFPSNTGLDRVLDELGELYSVPQREVGAFPCELSGLTVGKCSFLIHAPDSLRLRLVAQEVSGRMKRLVGTGD